MCIMRLLLLVGHMPACDKGFANAWPMRDRREAVHVFSGLLFCLTQEEGNAGASMHVWDDACIAAHRSAYITEVLDFTFYHSFRLA